MSDVMQPSSALNPSSSVKVESASAQVVNFDPYDIELPQDPGMDWGALLSQAGLLLLLILLVLLVWWLWRQQHKSISAKRFAAWPKSIQCLYLSMALSRMAKPNAEFNLVKLYDWLRLYQQAGFHFTGSKSSKTISQNLQTSLFEQCYQAVEKALFADIQAEPQSLLEQLKQLPMPNLAATLLTDLQRFLITLKARLSGFGKALLFLRKVKQSQVESSNHSQDAVRIKEGD